MTFYSGFFHDGIAFLRDNGIDVPIISGGPYPTASYSDILNDKNIDLCAIAEGELTLVEILEVMLKNNKKFPSKRKLKEIKGVAFYNAVEKNDTTKGIAAIPVTDSLPQIIKNL